MEKSQYSATFTPGMGILRVYEGDHSYERGSPYVLDCTIKIVGDTAIIEGLVAEGLTTAHRRAILGELAAWGMKWAEWERRKEDGPTKKIRVRI